LRQKTDKKATLTVTKLRKAVAVQATVQLADASKRSLAIFHFPAAFSTFARRPNGEKAETRKGETGGEEK